MTTMQNGENIMVVGSSCPVRDTTERMLRAAGYTVSLAAGTRQAISGIDAARPRVILLLEENADDCMQFLREVRLGPLGRSIPVIVMTGGDSSALQAMEHAGADEFISFPPEETVLRMRVKTLLKVREYNDHVMDFEGILEQEVGRRTQEITKAFEKIKVASLDTVYRLARAAEYKDEDTGSHVQRMSHYSTAVARRLGLEEPFVESILWAAPMHDIGKIGIPDRVLLKPGKLDEEEFATMKQHTVIGADILKDADADFMKLAAEIALTHHEKWNGEGYPRGIRATEIPLAGRIVAIADVFDALTTARPYKQPFPVDKAFAIIREGRGSHFDPTVVDAFFDIESEIRAELNWWTFMSSGPGGDDLSDLFPLSDGPGE